MQPSRPNVTYLFDINDIFVFGQKKKHPLGCLHGLFNKLIIKQQLNVPSLTKHSYKELLFLIQKGRKI